MAYITLADLATEGFTFEGAAQRVRGERLITLASAFLDKATGQWFEDREFTDSAPLILDGNGLSVLRLPVPIISVDSISICGDTIDLDRVVIYNRRVPDDRGDPRIAFRSWQDNTGLDGAVWPVGLQNIRLTGHFGYLDWDSSGRRITPEPIKQAVMKLVMRELPQIGSDEGSAERMMGNIQSETTDGHSYTLGGLAAGAAGASAMSSPITGDPEIDMIIAAYRAPLVCATI